LTAIIAIISLQREWIDRHHADVTKFARASGLIDSAQRCSANGLSSLGRVGGNWKLNGSGVACRPCDSGR
jgi:hypothetical protein